MMLRSKLGYGVGVFAILLLASLAARVPEPEPSFSAIDRADVPGPGARLAPPPPGPSGTPPGVSAVDAASAPDPLVVTGRVVDENGAPVAAFERLVTLPFG